jgi:succinylarginine dihydrolase
VLWKAKQADPVLLAACSSASSMWAANAGTVSPSADTMDGRVHFTPANLVSQAHRSLEAPTTSTILRTIFPDPVHFAHAPPLQAATAFGDEGAANHVRLAPSHGDAGVELFVYGRSADASAPAPKVFPARQTLEASRAVARLNALLPDRCVFARQNPAAIDRGVFHNDVACVGNEDVLLYHEEAFAEPGPLLDELTLRVPGLTKLPVASSELSLDDAVKTYLFNSQLVTLPDGSMALIAPSECSEHDAARRVIERLLAAGTRLRHVHYATSARACPTAAARLVSGCVWC